MAVALTLFLFAPQVMFDGRNGIAAIGHGLRACLHNPGDAGVLRSPAEPQPR
ncbi:hypothetical protein NB693_20685 [Pantoea ananatis]|uniref:hypothetical protein n=1 Tax=Pantoea ananas TaxID=553 RepID=UPI002220F280|nr:hypothetical protein [Pantoea ananatis]